MSNGRKFIKRVKQPKDEYYQLENWIINATQLEKTGFIQSENKETNFGFRCYLGSNQFDALSKNSTELHKRLQFIQSITPSLLLCDDVTEMIKTVIRWVENGVPNDLLEISPESDLAILDKMKAEDMLRKATELPEYEVSKMIEYGDIDIDFVQHTLGVNDDKNTK